MPVIEEGEDGGRIVFSGAGRSLAEEDQICILSVGVDIGSSTSHLVFSRIVLERLDARYVVTERETFYQSDILLTPYASGDEIDDEALGAFIRRQYDDAMVDPAEIDAGALILTGVAVRRSNARRIGELFAAHAGKLVAVSAGDSLETVMAAYGSGAVARSIRDGAVVMNVDVGGGTSKIAVCANGEVIAITAADIGARLVCTDEAGRIVRIEEAGRRFAADLGALLGDEIHKRMADWNVRLEKPAEGIRATVIGASQYTTQVSGSTIFVSPLSALPLRNVPVIAPSLALDQETVDAGAIANSIKAVLKRLDLTEADTAVAVFVPWRGSATFQRLDAFCRGVADGLAERLAKGLPIVLAGDGDVGGLIGIHFREEMKLKVPIVSIDGLELKAFDYIDIGEMLETSGAVPVVIKSLIFPASAAVGQEWKKEAAEAAT